MRRKLKCFVKVNGILPVSAQSIGSVVVGSQSVAISVVEEGWVSLSLGGSGSHGGKTSDSLGRRIRLLIN